MSMETFKQYLESGIEFVSRTGVRVLELAPGRVKLCMPLSGNENHIGTLYAGALFTLAELPGGALFLSSFDVNRFYPVIREMNIRYHRAARTDAFVTQTLSRDEIDRITREAEQNGKSDFTLFCEITDAQDTVVADSTGLYQIRAIKA